MNKIKSSSLLREVPGANEALEKSIRAIGYMIDEDVVKFPFVGTNFQYAIGVGRFEGGESELPSSYIRAKIDSSNLLSRRTLVDTYKRAGPLYDMLSRAKQEEVLTEAEEFANNAQKELREFVEGEGLGVCQDNLELLVKAFGIEVKT